MPTRRFIQCDVFTSNPTRGNGLAVVIDGEGLAREEMQAFAAWTNLAETTFICPPTNDDADYRLRIFSANEEMLFAGHPTLGSCKAWLHAGGAPALPGVVRQECGVGIVRIDIASPIPAFGAPKTTVEPLETHKTMAIVDALGLPPDRVLRSARLCNGPTWQIIELKTAGDVLAVQPFKEKRPEFRGVGLIGAHPNHNECQFEVRNLGPASTMSEDPITGSMNAAIACWMYGAGHWKSDVTIAQGTCLEREGRVHVRRASDQVWIGGETQILIEGTLNL